MINPLANNNVRLPSMGRGLRYLQGDTEPGLRRLPGDGEPGVTVAPGDYRRMAGSRLKGLAQLDPTIFAKLFP